MRAKGTIGSTEILIMLHLNTNEIDTALNYNAHIAFTRQLGRFAKRWNREAA
jgi:hypothetical protein